MYDAPKHEYRVALNGYSGHLPKVYLGAYLGFRNGRGILAMVSLAASKQIQLAGANNRLCTITHVKLTIAERPLRRIRFQAVEKVTLIH